MSLIRVQRTAAAALTRTFYVDETATNCTGSVAVVVSRADGTVLTSGTATQPGPVGQYQFVLPGQALLNNLDVAWSGTLGGAVVTLTDRVEIVGGFLFGLAEARASDASLADAVKYPTAALRAERTAVEQECERLTGRSFVPRFRRVVLNGTGGQRFIVPDVDVRVLRSVSTLIQPGGALTALASLANVSATPAGVVTRYDGGGYWPAGTANLVAEYEYGTDFPPTDLVDAALVRLRTRLNRTRSGVPDRVSSYSTPDGASYNLRRPVRGSTGIDDVDAVYADYEAPPRGFA